MVVVYLWVTTHLTSLLTAGAYQPSSLLSPCHRRLDTCRHWSEGGCCLSLTHHAPHKSFHRRSPNFRSHLTAGALSHANCLVALLPPALWHLLPRSEVGRSTTRLFNFTQLCIVLRPALSCQNLTLYDAYNIFLVSIFYCANFNILILSIFNMKSPRGCVDTIVSTYLYIDYYSIIWINYYLCFVLSEAKMMATQRHPTRRASRVARSKRGPRQYYSRI